MMTRPRQRLVAQLNNSTVDNVWHAQTAYMMAAISSTEKEMYAVQPKVTL
jgi:hypothetical protein